MADLWTIRQDMTGNSIIPYGKYGIFRGDGFAMVMYDFTAASEFVAMMNDYGRRVAKWQCDPPTCVLDLPTVPETPPDEAA